MPEKGKNMIGQYAGIFFISMATLMLEISLTRIFSVTIWYHFAFMVISIALLGFGASGTFLSVFRPLLEKKINKMTTLFSLLFSFSCLLSLLPITLLPLDPFGMTEEPLQFLYLFIYYATLLMPFLFAGLCISFLLSRVPLKVGKLYFSDLVGAGLGSSLAIFLIPLVSNTGMIVLVSLVGLLASLFFNAHFSKRCTVFSSVLIIILFPLLLNAGSVFKPKIAKSKGLFLPVYKLKVQPVLTKWNAFSRIDVVKREKSKYIPKYTPGLSSKYFSKFWPDQIMVFIDADAIAPITRFDGDLNKLEFLNYLPSSLAYQLREKAKVCIIGPGGGFEVLMGLLNKASSITAVEINPIIVNLVKQQFNEFSGGIYNNEKVNIKIKEGRTFIHGSKEKFDIIQLSLVDTWAASSSGAYCLSENYLYTKEAFREYFNHLSPDGILTVTRWMFSPPKEIMRLCSLAVSALDSENIAKPEGHIVVIAGNRAAAMLLKKTAFSIDEEKKLYELSRKYDFQILYSPRIPGDNKLYQLLLSKDKAEFYKSYLYRITPSTDDKPFFFHYYGLRHINPFKYWRVESVDRNMVSYLVILAVLAQALILSVVLILLPLRVLRKREISTPFKGQFLFYFLCLGIGFMFIEITLMQKFILFLGHPSYSLSVVLFSLLLFSGLGSLFSEKLTRRIVEKLSLFIILLSGMVLAYIFLLPALIYQFISKGLLLRFVISCALLAPCGFLMGIPFPVGIRIVNKLSPNLIPWTWAVNGCASVLSSILAIMIALGSGFSTVLSYASGAYLAGLMMILIIKKKVTSAID